MYIFRMTFQKMKKNTRRVNMRGMIKLIAEKSFDLGTGIGSIDCSIKVD